MSSRAASGSPLCGGKLQNSANHKEETNVLEVIWRARGNPCIFYWSWGAKRTVSRHLANQRRENHELSTTNSVHHQSADGQRIYQHSCDNRQGRQIER